jgi:hypothetical protein
LSKLMFVSCADRPFSDVLRYPRLDRGAQTIRRQRGLAIRTGLFAKLQAVIVVADYASSVSSLGTVLHFLHARICALCRLWVLCSDNAEVLRDVVPKGWYRRIGGRPGPLVVFSSTRDFLADIHRMTGLLVNQGYLGVLRLRRIREDAIERQSGDKQRAEDAFRGALLPAIDASAGWCRTSLPGRRDARFVLS